MTWNELKAIIEAMPEEEREKEVIFWDKDHGYCPRAKVTTIYERLYSHPEFFGLYTKQELKDFNACARDSDFRLEIGTKILTPI